MPGTCSGTDTRYTGRELSRPRQAERQRAERHEPRLAGEIVKEIIADARNLQQQREEEEKRRVVAEMAAQGYHVDTETGEITRIENKPGQALPDSAATPAGEPTGEDLADFGAWSKERENRLWEQHPPKPEDFGMADTPVQHVGGTTEPKPQEGFAGSLFDTVETAAPVPATQAAEPVNVQQEPLLTLYDLFGFSAEERRQAELGISKKRNSRRGAKRKTPRQPSLFAPASSPEEQKSEMPKTTPPERDPEDLYASPELGGQPADQRLLRDDDVAYPGTEGGIAPAKRPAAGNPGTAGTAGGTPPDGSPERQTETSRRYAENGQPVRHAGQSGGGRTR